MPLFPVIGPVAVPVAVGLGMFKRRRDRQRREEEEREAEVRRQAEAQRQAALARTARTERDLLAAELKVVQDAERVFAPYLSAAQDREAAADTTEGGFTALAHLSRALKRFEDSLFKAWRRYHALGLTLGQMTPRSTDAEACSAALRLAKHRLLEADRSAKEARLLLGREKWRYRDVLGFDGSGGDAFAEGRPVHDWLVDSGPG